MSRVLVVLLVIAGAAVGISARTEINGKSRSERAKVSDDDKRTRGQGVVEIGPRTTYLQEGLSSEAVLRARRTIGHQRTEARMERRSPPSVQSW